MPARKTFKETQSMDSGKELSDMRRMLEENIEIKGPEKKNKKSNKKIIYNHLSHSCRLIWDSGKSDLGKNFTIGKCFVLSHWYSDFTVKKTLYKFRNKNFEVLYPQFLERPRDFGLIPRWFSKGGRDDFWDKNTHDIYEWADKFYFTGDWSSHCCPHRELVWLLNKIGIETLKFFYKMLIEKRPADSEWQGASLLAVLKRICAEIDEFKKNKKEWVNYRTDKKIDKKELKEWIEKIRDNSIVIKAVRDGNF